MNKKGLFKDLLRELDAACNQPKSDYRDGYCDALEMVLKKLDKLPEPDDAMVDRKDTFYRLANEYPEENIGHYEFIWVRVYSNL